MLWIIHSYMNNPMESTLLNTNLMVWMQDPNALCANICIIRYVQHENRSVGGNSGFYCELGEI